MPGQKLGLGGESRCGGGNQVEAGVMLFVDGSRVSKHSADE